MPIVILVLLLIIGGAGGAAWGAAHNSKLVLLTGLFWGIFALQIVVSINISPPGLSFDPESLIRFPLNFSRYLVIRLFLGLLSASTIVGTLALLAAATGIAIAIPSLAFAAFVAVIILAITNMLFVRMVFAWVDRWLSTRRAREIFTAFIFIFSIGVQYLNVTFNGVGKHTTHAQQAAKIQAVTHAYAVVAPALENLPPGLAANAIRLTQSGAIGHTTLNLAGIMLFGVFFLAIFAWRTQREYRGENLSEAVNSPEPAPRTIYRPTPAIRQAHPSASSGFQLPPVVAACLHKEWLYVRRNTAQFYALVAPLAMVFIFAGRASAFARTGFSFPVAVAYSMLGISAMAYNTLGLDAAGVQFYFIAPIRMRSVILAKNLFNFGIVALQVALVYALLFFTTGAPPLIITLSTLCWITFATLVNITVGNIRSLTTPKKIDVGKLARKQASQMSALISIGLMLVAAALGFGLIMLGKSVGHPWLPVPIFAALAIAALVLYLAGLDRIDAIALSNREILIEELQKAT